MTLRQKKREAKAYQLLSEAMESLTSLAAQKRWMVSAMKIKIFLKHWLLNHLA